MWGQIVLVVALAGTSVSAEDVATFPELARQNAGARIVSGWFADPGQVPHQLALRMTSVLGVVSACGASIIHKEWAISAAHCTADRVTIIIRAGGVNLTRPDFFTETTEKMHHPLYDATNINLVQHNDISLIKFRPLEFNFYTQPIRIQRHADRDVSYDQIRMSASGFGRVWTNGFVSEHLIWVFLRGVTNAECFENFGDIVASSTVCASGYNVTSQSTCQGDSGGPLSVTDKDGKETLIGVASFVSGRGCHVGLPAGFIRAGYYHDWFTEVTGINFDWDFEEEPDSSEEEEQADQLRIVN